MDVQCAINNTTNGIYAKLSISQQYLGEIGLFTLRKFIVLYAVFIAQSNDKPLLAKRQCRNCLAKNESARR